MNCQRLGAIGLEGSHPLTDFSFRVPHQVLPGKIRDSSESVSPAYWARIVETAATIPKSAQTYPHLPKEQKFSFMGRKGTKTGKDPLHLGKESRKNNEAIFKSGSR